MNKDKLKLLIKVLENVPEEQFNMTSFAYEEDCGTVCCALGWAAISDEFPDLFLRDFLGVGQVLHTSGSTGYLAGASEFDIHNRPDIYYLFAPSYYYVDGQIKPSHVIEHINVLLERENND
jgi:hypothetical protein